MVIETGIPVQRIIELVSRIHASHLRKNILISIMVQIGEGDGVAFLEMSEPPGRRYIDNFVNVQAKEPVVLLQNLGALEVVVAVPEQDWSRAKPGRTYEEATALLSPVAILSTFPGREFALTFSEVATVADPVTRTFEIRLTLDRPEDITVMPGMTANVRITTPPPDSEDDAPIVLPTAAVFGNDQGGSSVWLVDPDTMTVSERVVELGPLTANGVDIVAGLTAGDRIAVSGVGNLREGMQVSEFER